MESVLDRLERLIGRRQVAELAAEAEAEVAEDRREWVDEIARLRAEASEAAAKLKAELGKAEQRRKKALEELTAAGNGYNAIRRKLSLAGEKTSRAVGALEARLRETADKRIDETIERLRKQEAGLLASITTKNFAEGRFATMSEFADWRTNRPDVLARCEAIRAAIAEIESLRLAAADDLPNELARIESTIPTKPIRFVSIDKAEG